jgi:general secretion pathway protein A
MYLDFFGFRKAPFHVTPDPDFLFLSTGHREALASIVYGVEQRKGFIALVGEVGVGKTTVLRSYLEEADSRRLKAISLFNPKVSFEDLLRIIHRELGSDPGPGGVAGMVDRLQHALIDEYRQGRNVALVVDEAQAMPVETLEGLRLLSNLETSTDKLVQIVLVGQPELDQMLGRPELRQLRQRIAVRAVILPLSRSESIAYARHRLSRVTRKDASVFTGSALGLIVGRAGGIPRIINILCDNALITAFGYRKKTVGKRVVREILADYDGRTRRGALRWSAAASALLVFATAGTYIIRYEVPVVTVETPASARVVDPERSSLIGDPPGAQALSVREEDPFPGAGSGIPPESGRTAERQDAGPGDVRGPNRSAAAGEGRGAVARTVQKGDSLSKLVEDVYGLYSPDMLQRVVRSNPAIRDPDRILEGEKIVFPEPDGAWTARERIGNRP